MLSRLMQLWRFFFFFFPSKHDKRKEGGTPSNLCAIDVVDHDFATVIWFKTHGKYIFHLIPERQIKIPSFAWLSEFYVPIEAFFLFARNRSSFYSSLTDLRINLLNIFRTTRHAEQSKEYDFSMTSPCVCSLIDQRQLPITVHRVLLSLIVIFGKIFLIKTE